MRMVQGGNDPQKAFSTVPDLQHTFNKCLISYFFTCSKHALEYLFIHPKAYSLRLFYLYELFWIKDFNVGKETGPFLGA